ncbi:hypothetical protein ABW19_dt0205255 [Dactylella cylindrospora]|nr:hypothetical protein ABW19_dt0205255 [Dactylella cylindrospora]
MLLKHCQKFALRNKQRSFLRAFALFFALGHYIGSFTILTINGGGYEPKRGHQVNDCCEARSTQTIPKLVPRRRPLANIYQSTQKKSQAKMSECPPAEEWRARHDLRGGKGRIRSIWRRGSARSIQWRER